MNEQVIDLLLFYNGGVGGGRGSVIRYPLSKNSRVDTTEVVLENQRSFVQWKVETLRQALCEKPCLPAGK